MLSTRSSVGRMGWVGPTLPSRAALLVVALTVVLAVPIAWAPGTGAAVASYLVGFSVVVAAVWLRAVGWTRDRRAWTLAAAALSSWLLGDLVQRFVPQWEYLFGGAGAPDVLWLAGYPLMLAAVLTLVRSRGLNVGTLRELVIDSAALTVAAAVVAWQVMVLPNAEPALGVAGWIVTVAYPLGDVLLVAMGCALAMTPGVRRGESILLTWLGATLLIDVAFLVVPAVAPDFDTSRMDAALLVTNALLAAAALHSSGAVAAAKRRDELEVMPGSRVVLLGAALVVTPAVACLSPHPLVVTRLVLVACSVVVTALVLLRLSAVVRLREAAERRAAHQASHDALTGLANRSMLARRADEVLVHDATARRAAVLFVDVDQFKMVNDVYGHAVGDAVLQAVATRVGSVVRPQDTVARIGGDEYVALCVDLTRGEAHRMAARLASAGSGPVAVEGTVVEVTVSVGCVHADDLDDDAARSDLDVWLRAADESMYAHKRRRRLAEGCAPHQGAPAVA